jgi:hypothetical protein
MFPAAAKPTGLKAPAFLEVLKGAAPTTPTHLNYYVINANVWKQTTTWPPPHTPVSYYLCADGALSTNPTVTKTAGLSFEYHPKNPAPSIGGGFSYSSDNPSGPMDQRPLRERKDVLRFVTGPLDQPVEIAGKLRAELFVSSDAPDTMFSW